MKKLPKGLKPISEKQTPKSARVASQAHRSATRKKRIELRQRGLPMIVWKNAQGSRDSCVDDAILPSRLD